MAEVPLCPMTVELVDALLRFEHAQRITRSECAQCRTAAAVVERALDALGITWRLG